MSDVDALSDRYVGHLAAADPCLAAMMGIAGHDGELTDYGPDGFAARHELAERTLAELAATPVNSDSERRAAAVLRDRLEIDLARSVAGYVDADLNTVDGPPQRLRQAIEVLDQGERTVVADMRSRLAGIPEALAGLRESLERGRQQGRVSAVRQVVNTARQSKEFADYLGTLPPAYRAETERAGDALVEFASYLTDVLAPAAPVRDAVGRERYALEARNFLGSEIDLLETYEWGWQELARLEAEMREVGAQIRPGEPLPAVLAALDADPAHRVAGAEQFRAWIQELADKAIADLDGTHFDIPEPLRRLDCRVPGSNTGIYYLAPAEDLSRPGTVWYSVTEDEPSTWAVPSVMFHEGAPGHHLQLGLNVLNTRTLNRFQRLSAELHVGHGEGWGIYAERLMDELGYYELPAHRMGMLAGGQQLRAVRVIVDIGLHLELPIPAGAGFHDGAVWTPDLAFEFVRDRSGSMGGAEFARFQVDRYLGLPGQAIAYKVGERVWLAARAAAQARQGSRFDLRTFHSTALDLGPMGLDLLTSELATLLT
ncbi:DUF885 domain-containing protein [Kutzneria kofuensis]|uniref:Uncharacterized protein (DUF885 family) n=1 Tax=Kutzneria kofuensis TaxID=103725 RepID=A0A7W9NET4_9PSEU|nr:DUF885 domain-containing protein [Kutzneria kofuensis]MBB5889734.1 uncharacterized protein (DUF885 family) [Kutzneria kofuensis]